MNRFFLGDNLEILQTFPSKCIDLTYIDPPFNIGKDFDDRDGKMQFTDRWRWDKATSDLYYAMFPSRTASPLSLTLYGFECMYGRTPTLAYLVNMTARLIEIRRVLKSTGVTVFALRPYRFALFENHTGRSLF